MTPATATLTLMLQAAAAPPLIALDNPKLRSQPQECAVGAGASNDIVVCGQRESPYRTRSLGPPVEPERLLPDARFRLKNGGSVALHADQQAFSNGTVSKRAMVTLSVPF